MGLAAIGPVTISHGDPQFVSNATPTGHGIRTRRISGSCSYSAWHQLDEMFANPSNRATVAGRTGVQEWLEFDDDLLAPFTGYYLLEDWAGNVAQQDSLADTDAPFSFTAAYLGDLA